MSDLIEFLQGGQIELFVVLALTLALVWVVRQWRQAESDKDDLHNERLKDAREMYVLAGEVKTSIETLVRTVGGSR